MNINNKLRRQLKAICTAKVEQFAQLGDVVEPKPNQLVHIDNGASILGVAHLDTVLTGPYVENGKMVYCPQLDDRLGAWVLLSLLPSLGLTDFDILLTTNEEKCYSSAQYFSTDKKYNWIFEFDRQGTDTVLYDYEDIETKQLLESYDFQIGKGSYSDICDLDLGIKGFNFGVGYHKQHTVKCYANLDDTVMMARKFIKFANENSDVKLSHYENYKPIYVDKPFSYQEEFDTCRHCAIFLEPEWNYCPMCGSEVWYAAKSHHRYH